MKIASVVIDNPSKEVDRIFDYIIPEEYESSSLSGVKVIVPFGNGNRNVEGYIIGIKEDTDYDISKLKSIIDILYDEQWIDQEMLDIALFVKDKYKCTLNEALRCLLPSGTNLKENIYVKLNEKGKIENKDLVSVMECFKEDQYVNLKLLNEKMKRPLKRADVFNLKRMGFIDVKICMENNVKVKTKEIYAPVLGCLLDDFLLNSKPRYKKQAQVLNEIVRSGEEMTISEICTRFECSQSVVKALHEKGYLKKEQVEVYRNPSKKDYCFDKVTLTDDQRNVIDRIMDNYRNGKNKTLIRGVTGCGKTEIYLNIVETFINNNYGAIVLVPEIALTPQTLERFKGRFGNVVAIIHSKLSEGERFDEYRRINSGEVKVVVGARSAIFAPVKNLKLIVIDEEHEYSYKSETTPKYHTRCVAEYRADRNGGLLIMGSATPSIESYYKALNGVYDLVEIDKRVSKRSLPEVTVIDMKNELKNGNKSIFSSILLKKVDNNLTNGRQTILFLNRRGYSTFISCRACGYVCKCGSCDVSLTYHANAYKMVCHYCGSEYDIPKTCPECGSKYIKFFGTGTERIELETNKYFSSAKTLRMDMDTTRKKGEHERIYNEFKEHKADILIGTQMISKGMDFKDVTLVGVIAADTTLNLPDFRAAERTFQLITQVAGRAGRGKESGEVIVQTYEPEHYSIKYAKNHDYKGFYQQEIKIRQMLGYPPFSDILYVLFTSEDENEIEKYCSLIGRELLKIKKENIEILGPSPCHIVKVKNRYRWHLILKGDAEKYYDIVDEIINKILRNSNIAYSMDINSYNMF